MSWVTQAAYARHRGISRAAVSKRTIGIGGPIPTYGPKKLIDVAEADALWEGTKTVQGEAGAEAADDADDLLAIDDAQQVRTLGGLIAKRLGAPLSTLRPLRPVSRNPTPRPSDEAPFARKLRGARRPSRRHAPPSSRSDPMPDPANKGDQTSVDDRAAANKPGTAGVLVETLDQLLAQARDVTLPLEWRAAVVVQLDDALLAARARGETLFRLTAPRDDGMKRDVHRHRAGDGGVGAHHDPAAEPRCASTPGASRPRQ